MPVIPATQEAEAVVLQIRGQPQKCSETLSRDKLRKGAQWQGTPGSILSSEKNAWHILWVATTAGYNRTYRKHQPTGLPI